MTDIQKNNTHENKINGIYDMKTLEKYCRQVPISILNHLLENGNKKLLELQMYLEFKYQTEYR